MSILIDKLKDPNYYKNKLPLSLKSSYGMQEQIDAFTGFMNGPAETAQVESMEGLNIGENLGNEYLYVGSTNENFTFGHVYKVVENTYYQVIYNLNGGEGSVPVDSDEYLAGSTVTVKFDALPTYERKLFIGWSLDAEAADPEFTDDNIDSFTINSDTILYAIYKGAENFATDSFAIIENEAKYIAKYYDENGELPEMIYSIGDEKEVAYGVESYTQTIVIIDFVHDTPNINESDYGSTHCGITWSWKYATKDLYSSSNIPSNLDSLVPQDMKSHMVKSNRDNYYTFLFTIAEILGTNKNMSNQSYPETQTGGTQYKYYADCLIPQGYSGAINYNFTPLHTGSNKGTFYWAGSSPTALTYRDVFNTPLHINRYYYMVGNLGKKAINNKEGIYVSWWLKRGDKYNHISKYTSSGLGYMDVITASSVGSDSFAVVVGGCF